MWMEEIVQKVEKLLDTEKKYLNLIESAEAAEATTIIELIINAASLAGEINVGLTEIDRDIFEIEDDEIRIALKNIREGRGFESVSAYNTLRNYLKSKGINNEDSVSEGEEALEGRWDELFGLFHARFDINSYFFGKLKVGPIITAASLPIALSNYFSELREAYAFGLYNSCLALCRMLLEMGLADTLSKIDKYKDASDMNRKAKDKPSYEFGLFENINIASSLKLLSNELTHKAHGVRLTGNRIVHSKGLNTRPKSLDTLQIIKDTVAIVEALYQQ